MSDNIIVDKSFTFALRIIHLYKELVEKKEYILSKQVLRSGTSIGANVQEGTAAQSRRDFLSKMTIASKEARETQYWLQLLKASDLVKVDVTPYMEDCNELVRILTSIVKTVGSSV
jgi:four helix bundle protein